MRNIIRLFKGAGILNLLGMTVAFAAIYIIMVQVNYDWNYNSKIKDLDRIFVVTHKDWFDEGKYSVNMSRPVMESLIEQSSMVESYAVLQGNIQTEVKIADGNDNRAFELNTMQVTSGTYDVFGIEAVAGTFQGIGEENVVALSERASRRLNLKLGDAIQLEGEKDKRTVSAIFKDMAMNSIFGETDLLYSNIYEKESLDNFGEWSYRYFVKLNDKNNVNAFSENATNFAKNLVNEMISSNPDMELPTQEEIDEYVGRNTVKIFPLEGFQFELKITDNTIVYQCNIITTITLFIVSVLILVITLINYLNFFMAQIPAKLRSVNTRKILGSSRLSLVMGFMAESAILVVVSLFFSYIVIKIIGSSTYAELISCPLDLGYNAAVAILTVFVALIMTVASSIYPAMHVTSFSPALAIKGTMGTVSRGKSFRYILVGFQFFISILFVLCAFFIKMQYDYMMNYDMGFNKESLFTAYVPVNSNNRDLYTTELQKKTAIKEVAWGASSLVSVYRMGWGREFNGKNISFISYPVSYNFLKFMGIDIVEGRDFTQADEKCEKGIFIFNEIAKEKFGFSLESKVHEHISETDIAGFCENFKFKPLHYKEEPFAFYVFGKKPWWPVSHLYIRSNPGATYSEVLQAVKEVVADISPNFNTEEINLKFFDEELGTQYRKEQKLISLITLFTILAVIISLMGIIGLLMFETKFRRKEIGLRRVHGASIREILEMFNRKFFYILLISFLIAAPVGYIVMDYYYSTFAYRTPLHWWVFLLAFVMVAIITVGVVTLCSYKAASENPAETLKNE
ncbi:acidobacterial duplicated orphan permease [uncultured Bacteroides sp.]|uniref:ABC transporter permease n=1 Tax=Bacteroides cellulolyticus TaxID=2981780 RepID=UPI000822F85E|nr:ABC transporter permease [Bacteroides cellulolyticus]MCU6771677.1 ABC transporter permease [Bacteroides cellulolyticus]SCH96949.1 acidobacterial duplicated orphan permease [uncultured Bacteroides sp.]